MPQRILIDSVDDDRVAIYGKMREKDLARDLGLLICEGRLLVGRLMESDYKLHSLLLERTQAQGFVDEISRAGLADRLPPLIYEMAPEVVEKVLGFAFHRGVAAAAYRKPWSSLDELMERAGERATVVICPEINNVENMGSIARSAAALGAAGLLLGPRCTDPLTRRTVKVSMGAVLNLPIARSEDLAADMARMRNQWGYELAATVLDPEAENLYHAPRGPRLGLALGSESAGLRPEELALCDRRLTLPMKAGMDSLNVATAAAIFLYELTRPRR